MIPGPGTSICYACSHKKKKKKKKKKKEKGCRGKVERSSFAAQQVKDSVFLWLQLWLLLWHGFDP